MDENGKEISKGRALWSVARQKTQVLLAMSHGSRQKSPQATTTSPAGIPLFDVAMAKARTRGGDVQLKHLQMQQNNNRVRDGVREYE